MAEGGSIHSQLEAYFDEVLAAIAAEDWRAAHQRLQALPDLEALLPDQVDGFDDPAWFPEDAPTPDQVEAAATLKEIESHTRLVDAFYEDLEGQVYQQGESHFRARRWPEALTCFEHLGKTHPASPDLEVRVEATKRRINLPLATGQREGYFPGFIPWLREEAAGPLTFYVLVLLILALFSLTITLNPQAAAPEPPAVSTIKVIRIPFTPTAILTSTTVPTTPTSAFQCQVVASTIPLRPGPGEPYGPVLGNLNRGVRLKAIGRNVDASWINVQVEGRQQVGWIPVSPNAATCNLQPAALALSAIPPVQFSE